MDYILTADKIYLTHTEVPKELEGKGIGSKLVKEVFDYIESEKLKMIPLCPFVKAYVQRHPEWKKLVLEGIKI